VSDQSIATGPEQNLPMKKQQVGQTPIVISGALKVIKSPEEVLFPIRNVPATNVIESAIAKKMIRSNKDDTGRLLNRTGTVPRDTPI
jgi:hypothetical protein